NSHPPDQPLECVYKIRVPNTLHVAIFIEQFELAAPNQCEQNYVEIYSGQAARKPLKRFCGIIATHTYTGQSVVFLRIFVASKAHADNSKLKNSHPPDQPLECVYKIRVPNTLHVAIFIEQFELAAPNQCEQNYVEIYSGQAARKPLKRFCGIIATHTYTGQSVVFLRIFVASKAHADNSKLKVFFSAYSACKYGIFG
uniref:CUB domain-containing protein n=1 Tax=Bursaphelenchus xylophilus TaxID=6326 RepID=A0A1I7SJX2_BURXY